MTTSNASAVWEGVLRSGRGHFKAGSGAFEGDYSFATRFEGARGTNPEELIAAAHAACLSMALSAGLEKRGTPATRISTKASCTVDKAGEGFKITRMRLEVRGKVAGLDQAGFARAAEEAKSGCPVSTALQGNVEMELDARLEELVAR
ncbi:MAG TPA: OsmC family protein [Gemmatimonadales bacterium]|nr:OsmC family protein [Gemmatimonadales bacterium]